VSETKKLDRFTDSTQHVLRDVRRGVAGINQLDAAFLRKTDRPLSRNGKVIRTPGIWRRWTKAQAGSRANKKFRFVQPLDSDYASGYAESVDQPTAPRHEDRYADITRVFPKIG
jgi:hypothetical protein